MGRSFGAQLEQILGEAGVTVVFGVPGGQTLPLYGAAKESGRMHVVMRDERNAACAADAFARVTGTVGFCDATMGPGVTNLVSGLAEAHASSVPVIALIADIPTDLEHLRSRSVASQSAAQQALLDPVTKWFGRVHRPEALADVMAHAVRVAVTGRPGPTVVEVPEDVFLGDAPEPDQPPLTTADMVWPRHRAAPDEGLLLQVADAIASASRPVLLAGGGVTLTGAAPAVTELAVAHGLPVVTTINGKGTVDERHELSAGVVGMFGSGRGNATLEAADLVLAVGTKLDQLSTHRWRLPRADQDLIHVDSDGEELGRALPCRLAVLADARSFAEALHRTLSARGWQASTWLHEVPETTSPGTDPTDPQVAPEAVVGAIDRLLRPQDLLVSDASLASGWAAAHYRVSAPGVGLVAPRGLAGIGWSPGAAIGARIGASADRRVVALAGDGSFSYGLGEIETACRLGLDLVYVVLNNSALAWIRHVEAQMGLGSSSGFSDVDFAAVARGLGASGTVVTATEDVQGAIGAALEAGGTHVVDVRTTDRASPIVGYGQLRRGAYQ